MTGVKNVIDSHTFILSCRFPYRTRVRRAKSIDILVVNTTNTHTHT